jgi:hypothetical protein
LSAALAAIPSDYQKGGMSIKFIQGSVGSSDNKYVQCRYMSSSTAVTDFTNVANWQGVDDEPVAGSNNLVKSGGVAKEINTLQFNIGGATSLPIIMTSGASITCNGDTGSVVSLTPVTDIYNKWSYAIVDCTAGDVFYIQGIGGGGPRLYCFIDSENKVITKATADKNQQTPLQLIAPSNSAKLIINDYNSKRVSYKGEKSFIANSDNVPTFGSNLPVKSGGVFDKINDLEMRSTGITVNSTANILAHTKLVKTLYNGQIPVGTKVKLNITSDAQIDIYITNGNGSGTQIFWWGNVSSGEQTGTVTTSTTIDKIELWTVSNPSASANLSLTIEIDNDSISDRVDEIALLGNNNKTQINNILDVLPKGKDVKFSSFDSHQGYSYSQSTFNG